MNNKLAIIPDAGKSCCRHIFLTGSPGIGKTTLIKKLCVELMKTNSVCGFYTEEIRNNNQRIGFDVVTLSEQRAPLARIAQSNTKSKFIVGKYEVDINSFESLALPTLTSTDKIAIVDEIGKMELFSSKFKTAIEAILNTNVIIIATVPLKSGNNLVNKIKNNKNSMLIEVTISNRNKLFDEIMKQISILQVT